MAVLKQLAIRLIKALAYDILNALVIGVIVWFIGNVVLKIVDWSFIDCWRAIYIALAIYHFVMIVLVRHVIGIHVFMRYMSHRIGVTLPEMREAILEAHLLKEKPISEWDSDWIRKQLIAHRASQSIARAIEKAFDEHFPQSHIH